jgi:drug/metabolite transporter (DMT)-like permease
MQIPITGEELPGYLLGMRLLIKRDSDGHPVTRPGAMTAPGVATAGRNQVPLGIAYMVGSTAMFAGGNAVVKWQLATYPLGEVAFGRTLFAFLTVAAIVLPRAGWSVWRTRRYRQHLQRGLSQFGSMLCWFLAVSVLSLGSATALGFAAPLFTTLLSIVILKEKVGIHRWSALIIGFVGVLIITHPGPGTLTYGALFALTNAVLISTVAIAIRRMSLTESTETLTLYQMSIMTLCTAGLLTLGFRAPGWGDVLMVALAGVGNGIAQFWWTRSLSLAPPSAVVPFNYLSLVWAMILGFAVWGDVPTPGLLVGSAIVVASGLYILWRETLRRRRPAVPAPQRVVRPSGLRRALRVRRTGGCAPIPDARRGEVQRTGSTSSGP